MPEPAGLYGPHPLRQDTIRRLLILVSPGTYVLGDAGTEGFRPRRVGRSDYDVAARIREFVGFYSAFKFVYCDSARFAFERECEFYHDYAASLDSPLHPSRQPRSAWRCAYCSSLDY